MDVLKLVVSGAIVWTLIGLAFFALFVAMEFIAMFARPDYRQTITDHKANNDGKSMSHNKFFVMWILMWPVLGFKVLHAMFRNQTLIEYLQAEETAKIAEQEAEKAKSIAAKKIVDDAREMAKKAPYHWVSEESPTGDRLMVLIRNFGDAHIPSHIVFIPKDPTHEILVARATERPQDLIPLTHLTNELISLPVAMERCEGDLDWTHLCVPTMHSVRRRAFKEIRSHLKKKGLV